MNKKYNKTKTKTKRYSADNKKLVIGDNTANERKEYICEYYGFNTVIRMDDETLYCNHCRGTSLIEDLQEVQQLPFSKIYKYGNAKEEAKKDIRIFRRPANLTFI